MCGWLAPPLKQPNTLNSITGRQLYSKAEKIPFYEEIVAAKSCLVAEEKLAHPSNKILPLVRLL